MSARSFGTALLAGGAALSLAAPAVAPAATAKADVKVMSRNLYLGADLIPLAIQPSLDAFKQAAGTRFQTVQGNAFGTRVQGLAAGIAKSKPDLIGVQEGAVWSRGADGVADGATTPATQLVYDSVADLVAALKAKGLSYKVVVKRPWFDFEAPTSLGYDVRLVQQDVVLARTGKGTKVKTGKTLKGGFTKTFDVQTQAGLVRSTRGWVGVDARLGKRKFRFVTTHLEAYSPDIAQTQMQQLLREPLKSKKRQTILVGDFNSDPKAAGGDRGTDRAPSAYATAIAAGFRNLLPRRETCCFAEDLHLTNKPLDQWIDHIVVRPRPARLVKSGITGNTDAERVGGLWPSDHAGIWATFRLR
jgi:endonuclease/exonuclease/phosphatase family metal-dependent hydrolase